MPASTGEKSVTSESTGEPARTQRTIGHDEFDPLGTLVLIFLYFLILIAMWVFTYFIEFLGNDPTPIMLW